MKDNSMKMQSIIFACIISTILQAEQTMQLPTNGGPTTIQITLNTANQAHLDQHNNLGQHANHHSQPQTYVKTSTSFLDNNSDIQQKLYEYAQQYFQQSKENTTSLLSWIQDNKIKTLGLSSALLYGYISYKIYQANQIINHPQSWSNWHNSNNLEDLFATPQNKLEADLLFAIQTRYVHPTNPTDFIYSLVQSSASLQQEVQTLQEQITLYQWLQTCHCMPLFFINPQELAILQDKQRKLSFIKHLFASWCANYKIDKNS